MLLLVTDCYYCCYYGHCYCTLQPQGYGEIVKALVKAGADVDTVDQDDTSALMASAASAHLEAAEVRHLTVHIIITACCIISENTKSLSVMS
jgi:hypothetical protein